MKLGITMLIHNKEYIEFVTEFPCFLGHPVRGSFRLPYVFIQYPYLVSCILPSILYHVSNPLSYFCTLYPELCIPILYPVSYRLSCIMYPILCPTSVPCILNCVSLLCILYLTVYPVSCIQSSVLLLYLVS